MKIFEDNYFIVYRGVDEEFKKILHEHLATSPITRILCLYATGKEILELLETLNINSDYVAFYEFPEYGTDEFIIERYKPLSEEFLNPWGARVGIISAVQKQN